MTEITDWRVYCSTDETYYHVYLPSNEPKPTTCPINTNHTIDSNLTADVSQHNLTQRVMIEEEESIRTQGYFRSKGFKMNIDGNVGSVTSFDISWPYDTTILEGWFVPHSQNVNDCVSADIAPNTITGSIIAPLVTGNNIIEVSETVVENAALGFNLQVTDGVNVDNLGEIIDISNNHLTMEKASTNTYSPSAPTYVRQTIKLIDNLSITHDGGRVGFAQKKQRGKGLPKNHPLRINYENVSGSDKTFALNIEYMY